MNHTDTTKIAPLNAEPNSNGVLPASPSIALSGDRPTGPLHLGHYVGSLQNRLHLQGTMPLFLLIADSQALTDNMSSSHQVGQHVYKVALDYLSVGLDPNACTIFVQSAVSALSELTLLLLNLTHTGRLAQNPTVRHEVKLRGFAGDGPSSSGGIPAGFFIYPVAQAADILAFNATHIPVGEDQLPMIEQCNELASSFNRMTNTQTFTPCRAELSRAPRLSGIYGTEKMSKSLNNAIYLSDDPDTISKKVRQMYTDPQKATVAAPGHIEGHVVFEFLDVFDTDTSMVAELKAQYQAGGLGDSVLKRRLTDLLVAHLEPMAARRKYYTQNPTEVQEILLTGTLRAKEVAQAKLDQVKNALGLFRL